MHLQHGGQLLQREDGVLLYEHERFNASRPSSARSMIVASEPGGGTAWHLPSVCLTEKLEPLDERLVRIHHIPLVCTANL